MSARQRYNLACALGLGHLIRLHLVVFGVGLLIGAASLQWEPEQWDSPVYGVALKGGTDRFGWLSPGWWAVILTLIAVIKLCSCVVYPRMVPLALALGSALFGVWFVSFAAAYVSGVLRPASPLLALMTAFVVGEHLAVASLMQRDRRLAGHSP